MKYKVTLEVDDQEAEQLIVKPTIEELKEFWKNAFFSSYAIGVDKISIELLDKV